LQKESMREWLSEQFKESLPYAVKASPKMYSEFLAHIEMNLDAFVRAIKSEQIINREAIVIKFCSIVHGASIGKQEKVANSMFMSHQVIADLEEAVSGKSGRGTSPFSGDYIWAGYGGKQGFIALDHSECMKRECVGPGYKKWHETHSPPLLQEACKKLKATLDLDIDEVHLSMMGLKRQDSTHVVVAMTGRRLSFTDIEHMLCKVYLSCTRARGSRNHGASRAWRNFCWPPKLKYTVWSAHLEATINKYIIETYEQVILQPSDRKCGGLMELDHPFLDL
jgi:hypothetical protein